MIKVTKSINLTQLDKELNGLGLNGEKDSKGKIIAVGLTENNPATVEELKSAIELHKAQDEKEPTVEEKLASVGLSLPDLKAALGL